MKWKDALEVQPPFNSELYLKYEIDGNQYKSLSFVYKNKNRLYFTVETGCDKIEEIYFDKCTFLFWLDETEETPILPKLVGDKTKILFNGDIYEWNGNRWCSVNENKA